MKVIGIIGAGAGGLCALRHVLNIPGLVPVIWEQSKVVGGTWVYTDHLEKDENGLPVHSSMYKSLKTNLPKETMGFPDFPFPVDGGDSFVHHTEVLSYLQRYAQHFHLLEHIKFRHVVERVCPVTPGSKDTDWQVTVRELGTDLTSTTTCHALLVCNGHYSVPNIPSLPGLDAFSGVVLHSHSYRQPDIFRGKTVVVLGAASSGMDISLELSTVADKVFLSHNLAIPIPSTLPDNIQQVAGVAGLQQGTDNTFLLRDGSQVQADALLLCTGYHYNFPFLAPECGVTVEENQVRPLYRHLLHCHYPSMAFIGIPFQICPFPFFDVQVRYFLNTLLRRAPVPLAGDTGALERDTAQYLAERLAAGTPPRHLHKMGGQQWPYCQQLAHDAGLPPLPINVQRLYDHMHLIRKQDLVNYKKKKFAFNDDDSFVELTLPSP